MASARKKKLDRLRKHSGGWLFYRLFYTLIKGGNLRVNLKSVSGR